MGRGVLLLLCSLWTFLTLVEVDPTQVIVVANQNDAESLELARYYQAKRDLPEEKLVRLNTSLSEEITWEAFIHTIYNPLRQALVERGASLSL